MVSTYSPSGKYMRLDNWCLQSLAVWQVQSSASTSLGRVCFLEQCGYCLVTERAEETPYLRCTAQNCLTNPSCVRLTQD